MTKKIALIIQGPIISSGVKGSVLRNKNILTNKNREHIVDFNCVDNILELAKKANDLDFDQVILSTWKCDEIALFENSNLFNKVIANDEENFQNIHIKNEVFLQNYKKQFHTLKSAADFLKSKNLDYIIKIRTDLSVDMNLLLLESRNAMMNRSTLINNGIRNGTRFLELDDFIFGSTKDLFVKWMETLENINFGKIPGAHNNLMISYLWAKHEESFKHTKLHFFHKNIINNSKKINNLAINEWENFHILDRNFWKDVKLRGDILDSRYFEFINQKPNILKHKLNYNFANYFNWKRNEKSKTK